MSAGWSLAAVSCREAFPRILSRIPQSGPVWSDSRRNGIEKDTKTLLHVAGTHLTDVHARLIGPVGLREACVSPHASRLPPFRPRESCAGGESRHLKTPTAPPRSCGRGLPSMVRGSLAVGGERNHLSRSMPFTPKGHVISLPMSVLFHQDLP